MRKHRMNESFFENIDTEAKAYWLGFLTADGAVFHNHLRVMLAGRDAGHLRKFVFDLNSDYEVSEKVYPSQAPHSSANVQIGSQKLVRDLARLGVTERKSLTVMPCREVPLDLVRHYWRGLVDGDGSIGKRTVRGREHWYLTLYGSRGIVAGFADYVAARLKTKAKVRSHSKIYEVSYNGNMLARKVIDLLYSESTVFLARKKKLAMQVLREEGALSLF